MRISELSPIKKRPFRRNFDVIEELTNSVFQLTLMVSSERFSKCGVAREIYLSEGSLLFTQEFWLKIRVWLLEEIPPL